MQVFACRIYFIDFSIVVQASGDGTQHKPGELYWFCFGMLFFGMLVAFFLGGGLIKIKCIESERRLRLLFWVVQSNFPHSYFCVQGFFSASTFFLF